MRRSQSIYFKKVHRLSKSWIQELLIHTGTASKKHPVLSRKEETSLKKSKQTNQTFQGLIFKGRFYQQKLVCVSGHGCMEISFAMEIILPWIMIICAGELLVPGMGNGRCPMVNKPFVTLILT